jgi:hypothetical protein
MAEGGQAMKHDRIDFLVEALLRSTDADEVVALCNQIGPLLEHHSNATAIAVIALILSDAAEATPDGLQASDVFAAVLRLAERMLDKGRGAARA